MVQGERAAAAAGAKAAADGEPGLQAPRRLRSGGQGLVVCSLQGLERDGRSLASKLAGQSSPWPPMPRLPDLSQGLLQHPSLCRRRHRLRLGLQHLSSDRHPRRRRRCRRRLLWRAGPV